MIAVDSARDDLIRIVRYIIDHSDIDIRLVSISKFDGGKILVPRTLIVQPSDAADISVPRVLDPSFAAVIAAYDEIAQGGWECKGQGRNYRLIYPDGWKGDVHYEFTNKPDAIGVELHLESEDVRHLAADLKAFAGQELTLGVQIEWDPLWSRNRGRLVAKFPKNQSPKLAAQAMKALIHLTRDTIERSLGV